VVTEAVPQTDSTQAALRKGHDPRRAALFHRTRLYGEMAE